MGSRLAVIVVLIAASLLAGPADAATTSSVLHGIAPVSATNIWAFGYSRTGGTNSTLAERWNGSQWRIVPTPNPGPGGATLNEGVAFSGSNVWVVGSRGNPGAEGSGKTLVEHWDGSAWTVVPSPNPGMDGNVLRGAGGVSPTDIWAVGFLKDGTADRTLIEHWDGTSWSAVPSPNVGAAGNYLSGVAAISANDVWAFGSYLQGGVYRTLTLHWDGGAWSVIPSPNPGSGSRYPQGDLLRTGWAGAPNDVWAVGRSSEGSVFRNLTLHWDGSAWNVVPAPNASAANNELRGIAGAVAGHVWTVGYYDKGSSTRTLTERWDGTQWQTVASPNVGKEGSFLKGIAPLSASNAWAVGYSIKRGLERTLIERWNGSTWRVVPSPNA